MDLFWIRLAGEAVNNVTPLLDIGGEPLKAHLVSKRFHLPLPNAVASTVVARTSIFISQAVFMLFGAVLSFELLALPTAHRARLVAALLVVCFLFVGFLALQRRGAFRRMNQEISRFYAQHGDRFWSAAALNGVSWVAGGVETYLFCRLVGLDLALLEAIVLEALLQLVRTGSFFIPMSLGAQEGGLAFFIHAMGYDPVAGVALSLLKRARQLLWTAAGFLVWGVYRSLEAKRGPAFVRAPAPLSFDTRLDRWIHRPVANVIARLFSGTPVTPNQVTVCSLAPALLSCAFFSVGGPAASWLAFFFFYLWSVLDHVDGALARLKQRASAWGRWLDDGCDIAASALILCGVFWGLEGLWNAPHRLVLGRLFYSGLFLNAFSAFLVLYSKRRSRNSVSASRDAFYALLLFVIAAHHGGPSQWFWYTFVMGFLIIGLFTVSAVSFWESAKPS